MSENEVTQAKSSTGLDPKVAAMLCYIPVLISGVIFWVIEKENKDVRFHAMQSILLGIALIAFWIVVSILIAIIHFLWWLIWPVELLFFVLWVLLVVKAYQGERFKLPVIGDIAEKQVAGA